MRINLTRRDLVNLVYMQLGFSKQISENLIEDFLSTIVLNIKKEELAPTIQILFRKTKFVFSLFRMLWKVETFMRAEG